MKINWGTGIVIAIIGFISFIMFFVVKMTTSHDANHDLVTEDYYKAELGYQKEIDAEQNAKDEIEPLQVTNVKEGLLIVFPNHYDVSAVSGNVSLYRPSNKHLDFDLPIALTNSKFLIPNERLLDGRWDIKIAWSYQGKEFLFKKSITH
ncbi:FixH protein [Maribacter sedimenticola]|uniref:FixH protein n=1 Tax=Maribacter sedimenticola TaxID=228956 RepID=A0ABY1SFF0_9FLAO|nr:MULTISPECIES: FixH family protein [Maribacter]TVZ14703.1 FixH protein [Maribacter sp. MAR_2009_72]SNR41273.1 FixH protein [Maribacter sedimenticola]